ncbi:MAG TPA: TIGR00730 family Rossman fold protein [Candidatus Limnocylindria bacterium]|nr:TIGR00730 family Rossman fold protein [Candidatus Limnocylindria bacterium]
MKHNDRPPEDPELRRRVEELIAYKGGGYNRELVADIVENALKLLRDVEHRGDVRIIQTAIRELRYSFRLFAPYSGTRKVTIFGSARLKSDSEEYQLAVELGRRIAEIGWMVITGAGPGIMQAGNEGAGPDKSFGANIRLPWEQNPNPVVENNRRLITFRYFFTRKLVFIRHSDAVVLFPGGFGTLDEGYEALTLMQTGKSKLLPLILLDKPGGNYWRTWDEQIRSHLLEKNLISPDDIKLYRITDKPEEAVRWIRRFYRNYHSMRFVEELLVIRLHNLPSPTAISALNEDFADMINGPGFQVVEPTAEEIEDDDAPKLHRLAFGFDRRSYGRLRQMIDVLNGL